MSCDSCCPPAGGEDQEAPRKWWADKDLLVPLGSGLFLAVGYALEWANVGVASTIALGLGLALGASTFTPGALRGLVRGRLGVGLLMTIAAIGAVALGHVGEAAALAFLFSIAEALEDRAMGKAKQSLRSLLALIPETATVVRPSGWQTIPASEIRQGDLLAVRPGERIATDGVIVTGRSSIDASAITGESIPLEVGPGDAVPAGAINGGGALDIDATADGTDNSLTTIVQLVEQANARKGRRARLADRIARPLVPLVLVAAVLIAAVGSLLGDPAVWIERALVVLVAASPCAMAIAVPVTVISAIGAASKFGVVIKSGQAFEQMGTVQTVAFDKTGTLTENAPQVVQVVAAPGTSPEQVISWAAALEAHSTHPVAAAIHAGAQLEQTGEVRDLVESPGRGLAGTVDNIQVKVGSPRWVDPGDLRAECQRMEGQGITVVVVSAGDSVVGLIGVRDELRAEAAQAVATIHSRGLSTVMLTGDNRRTADALALQAGITQVYSEQLPADKAAAIEELVAKGSTAMIGDGINDAPALAAADVGIAMGVAGSAAAIESADVVFTGSSLLLIPQALDHARRGRRIMTANMGFALAIIVVLFPLALFGVLGLAGVVLVHEVAEVLVILNGLRAARLPAAVSRSGGAALAQQEPSSQRISR